MRAGDFLEFSLSSLRKRKLRTFLTVFGVTIGIGALVSMLSFGKGMQRNITEAFTSSGLFNSLTVLPTGPAEPGHDPDDRLRPTPSPGQPAAVLDDKALSEIVGIPGVVTVFPDINIPALVSMKGHEEFRLIQVVPAEVVSSRMFKIGWGRPYGSDDEEAVLVASSLLRRFGVNDPGSVIGDTIRVSSISFDFTAFRSLDLPGILSGRNLPVKTDDRDFMIVGVAETSAFGGPNPFQNDIFLPPGPSRELGRLPFTSVWDLFRFREGRAGYSALNVQLRDPGELESVKERVRAMGFSTFALADQFEQVQRSWVYLDMILTAVGMIAIVVAALGITNTMVMSILERYREIGIMKAVGAGDGDVRKIFFFESAAIGFSGGLFGCLLGWTVSQVINRMINFTLARQGMPPFEYFAYPFWLFLGAVIFSILVSLIAGIYPASRAARVDPVVALRHD